MDSLAAQPIAIWTVRGGNDSGFVSSWDVLGSGQELRPIVGKRR